MKEEQKQESIMIRCESCIFCGINSGRTQILCRRRPPIVGLLTIFKQCLFPRVNPQHDYCGEFTTSDSESFIDFASTKAFKTLRKEIQKIVESK